MHGLVDVANSFSRKQKVKKKQNVLLMVLPSNNRFGATCYHIHSHTYTHSMWGIIIIRGSFFKRLKEIGGSLMFSSISPNGNDVFRRIKQIPITTNACVLRAMNGMEAQWKR